MVKIEKQCSGCEEVKPITAFSPRVDRPGGLYSRCKACRRAAERGKYAQARAAAGPAQRRTSRRRTAVEVTAADFEGDPMAESGPKRPKITIEAPVPAAEPEFDPFRGTNRLGMLPIRRG